MEYRKSRLSAEGPAALELPGYRASALVEHASTVMALVSRDGALNYVNGTGRRVLGLDELEPQESPTFPTWYSGNPNGKSCHG